MEENINKINNNETIFTEEQAIKAGKELALFEHTRIKSDHFHFSAEELIGLLEKRKKRGPEWQIPEALTKCELCLNSFEALIKMEEENISAAVIAKIKSKLLHRKIWHTSFARYFVRIAAGFIIIASIWYGITKEWDKAYPTFAEGTTSDLQGNILTVGAKMPKELMLYAVDKCVAKYRDGTTIDFDSGSIFNFKHTIKGDKVLTLLDGGISAEVAKQRFWQNFTIQTDLGTVKVIGTKFDIKIAKVTTVVFVQEGTNVVSRQSSKTSSVTVSVKEGIVAVDNGKKIVKIKSGSQATIYSDRDDIVF